MARMGQAATELVVILGVALVVVVLFFVLSANMLTGARVQQNYDDARASVQALSEAADSVYAQGDGATRKVTVTLPPGTRFGGNSTFIGAPANMPLLSQNTIDINVNGTDVTSTSIAPLSGQFPSKQGIYPMRVTSRGAYVEIYPYLVDVDTRSVAITMAPGETRSAQITVSRVSSENVLVEPSQNWGFSDVSLDVSPSGAFYPSQMGTTLTVTVTASPQASDIYNSQITLTATGNESGTTDTISIPVSVNVVGSGSGGIVACVQEGDACREGDTCCEGLDCNDGVCSGGIVLPPSCLPSGRGCNPRMIPGCCEGICSSRTNTCP